MDIQKIEMLLRAIELGSLSKAASEYLYTPSAFSHLASSVEKEIGAKIIKRNHSGIEVENSEIVKKLQQICDLKNEILEMTGEATGEKQLTIGTYASIAKNVLPAIIKGFRNENKGIHINITVFDNLSEFMEQSSADVYFGEYPKNKDLVWTEIFNDPYMAVFPKDAKQNIFSASEKYNMPFVVPNDKKTKEYIKRSNFTETIEVNSHDDGLIIRMVEAEGAISVLPKMSLINCGDGVKTVPLCRPLERKLGLIYKNSCRNFATVKKFVEYMKNYKSDF